MKLNELTTPSFLVDLDQLDKNINLTFSNFEDIEAKRQNYLKSKNKNVSQFKNS